MLTTLWVVVSLAVDPFSSYRGRVEWFDKPEQACTFARGNMGSVLMVRARKVDGFWEIGAAVPVECEITVKTRLRKIP